MEAKLLIVEDETSLRASLQEYFEREGFDVATAQDGARALAALNQVNPDLIILDVQLPHVDGLEVCRTIRQRVGSAVGIIMISGIKKETLDTLSTTFPTKYPILCKTFKPTSTIWRAARWTNKRAGANITRSSRLKCGG